MSLIFPHDTLRNCWIPVGLETLLEITGSKKKPINSSSTSKGKTSSSSSEIGGDAEVNPETINPPSTATKPKASESVSEKTNDYEADASEEVNKKEQGAKSLSSSTPLTESFGQQLESIKAISANRTTSVKTEVGEGREQRLVALRQELEEA